MTECGKRVARHRSVRSLTSHSRNDDTRLASVLDRHPRRVLPTLELSLTIESGASDNGAMAIASPLRPASQNESDALVREARARQRRRRLIILASLIAPVVGAAVALYVTLATTGRPRVANHGPRSAASPSAPRCGIRVVGTRILDHSGVTTYRDPSPAATHQARCSGSTAWVIFANGYGMMHEEYVGVRSGDGGRTWRTVFAETPGVRPLHGIGAEVGVWRLDGPRSAYFVGLCPACGVAGTVSLSVTKDGGRTFHRYQVPGLDDAYKPTAIRVSGRHVTIRARTVSGRPILKTVTLTVR